MSSRLAALTARRAALQAECALQRDDAALAYGDIEQGVAKVDRVLLVAGAVALLAIGPARALSLVRRGLAVGLYAREARRLLR